MSVVIGQLNYFLKLVFTFDTQLKTNLYITVSHLGIIDKLFQKPGARNTPNCSILQNFVVLK